MIFLDTSYLIAFFIKGEEKHERAVEIAKIIKNEEKIISKLVVAETITVLKKKLQTKDITKIYDTLKDFTTAEDSHLFDRAFKHFEKHDGEISFFDAVYIAIMEDFAIHQIVSFDSDFNNKKGIIVIS